MVETQSSAQAKGRSRNWRLWAGLAFVALAVASFVVGSFFIDWSAALAEVQERRSQLTEWVEQHPVVVSAGYFALYVTFTGLSLPGAVLLTLAGAAVFGLWWALVLVSFASSTGATLALLTSRYLLRDSIQTRYGERLERVNRELDREGLLYLLSLRLNPVIPYFLINLLFGLTRMPARRFYWVSQLGMLPGTFIYSNAGAQLADVKALGDIVSLPMLLALLALSVFPLVARWAARWLRSPNSSA